MKTNTNKPVHTVKLGRIRASIWKNTGQRGTWYNVTIGRLFKRGEKFEESPSFSRDDLPLVEVAASQAFEWITKQ